MKAFIVVLVAVIVLGGGYLLFHKSPAPAKAPNQTQTQSSGSTQSLPNTITFNGNQFSPATLVVKSGTMVTIKNASSQELDFDSDPHPVHTDDTDLNVGIVTPGKSATFTATKIGAFGYHDHLDPSIHGKITIQ